MINKAISLNPSAISRALAAVCLLLVLASTAGQLTVYLTGHRQVFGLVAMFAVDAERNIPTFFSMLLLLFAALLLALISRVEKTSGASSRPPYWSILSFGFLFMAIDETISLHEMLVTPARALLGDGRLGAFHFAWVIPGIVLVLGLALFFVKFLWRLPARTRFGFVLGGVVYVGGAIGFELIGGRYSEMHTSQNLVYSAISTVEETLEMAGVIIFIRALLLYLASEHQQVQLLFDFVPLPAAQGADER